MIIKMVNGKIKTYECKICYDRVKSGFSKDAERVKGTRKAIRKHLREIHNKKHQKNTYGVSKKDFGQSEITKNMLSYEVD